MTARESDFDPGAFRRFELDGWSRKANAYHRFYAPLTEPLVAPLLDRARVGRDSRVLDIGSGPGYVLAAAAQRGAQPVGLDQAGAMADLCRRLLGPVPYLVAGAEEIPLGDESMDAVTGNFVLHHLPEPSKAMAEFARVLRPGGRVALTVWDRPERCRFLGVFIDSVSAAAAAPPAALPAGPPMVTDDAVYADLLSAAGFTPDPVESFAWSHDFGTRDRLWDGLLASSVRIAATITEQDAQTIARIRAAYDEIVDEYRTGEGLFVPVAARVITGTRRGQEACR